MQKKFNINLSIPQPCHEDWENMAPNERGRHCNSCNKTVIDFSLFTDKQLVDFFSKVTGSVCGRLTNFQTNRQLAYVEPARNHFLYKLLFGTALVTGIVSANANYNPNTKPLIESFSLQRSTEKPEQAPQGDTTHFISGMVVDSIRHKPLSSAIVAIKGTVQSVQTDENGNFKLFVPLKYRKKIIQLQCVYTVNVKEIAINTQKLPLTNITIEFKNEQFNIVSRYTPPIETVTHSGGVIVSEVVMQVPVKVEEPFDPFINADKQVIRNTQ